MTTLARIAPDDNYERYNAPDPVQKVREMAASVAAGEDGDTVYEAACDAGRAYRDDMDARRWALGDLGALLQERYPRFIDRYGRSIIDGFAIEVSARRRTIYEYIETARFYPDPMRRAIDSIFPTLVYSHYRTALRLSSARDRVRDLDGCRARALEFLSQCGVEGWTADQADYQVRRRRGGGDADEPLFHSVLTAHEWRGRAMFLFDPDTVQPGRDYRVTVNEVTP